MSTETSVDNLASALCKCGLRPPWHAKSCPKYQGLRIDPKGEVVQREGYFETRVEGHTKYSLTPDGPWLDDIPLSAAVDVDDTATVENTFGPLDSYDLVEPTDEAVEACARLIHEVNSELCRFANELVLEYTRDIRESIVAGIRRMIANPFETPEENHEAWMAYRAQEGWKLGRVKDPVAKTHPCMMPYDMLPPFQQLKDKMFQRIVRTFFGLPEPR